MQQNKIMGIILATAVSMIVATLIGPSYIHFVYADANCEKAGSDLNSAGNAKGNSKQCSGPFLEGPKEPVRSCDSTNIDKDNDGDTLAGCKDRGSN